MALRWYSILCLFVFLAACASLSEEACRGGDWAGIGYRDGANGRSQDYLQSHVEACSDFGIRPDSLAWANGRRDGLMSYCTLANAYREGRDGHRLRPVCGDYDTDTLTAENRRGLKYHDISREIDRAERRLLDINRLIVGLPEGDPARAGLATERSRLRLEILRLRSRRIHYI